MVKYVEQIVNMIIPTHKNRLYLKKDLNDKIENVKKDQYVFSSVFPNEEVMRKVDVIMYNSKNCKGA